MRVRRLARDPCAETKSMNQILPCPFCGCTNALVAPTSSREPVHYTVICTPEWGLGACGASGKWCDTEDEAIDAWNRRVQTPSEQ